MAPVTAADLHRFIAHSMRDGLFVPMGAKRGARDGLGGAYCEPALAHNWPQFLMSEKTDEANSLKTVGEPGRTRTCNPLIKSLITDILSYPLMESNRISNLSLGEPTPHG